MSLTCTALVLIHRLALLLVNSGTLLVSGEDDGEGDGECYLLAGGLALPLLDSPAHILALRLTEALASLCGASHQLTVLTRNSQGRGQHQGQHEIHLELHLCERS